MAQESKLAREEAEADELDDDHLGDGDDAIEGASDLADDDDEQLGESDTRKERPRRRTNRRRSEKQRRAELYRNYRIQEVIRTGQLILVQATKEQRGTKGAVFTSYISLPGRYTVLMPNTAHSGGVSRKIGSADDRKRLRKIVKELEVADGMSAILRTVAKGRTRAEIRRDFNYIVNLWSDIRERTLNSVGASLVHQENDLVKRAIRDLYQSDIDEVIVAGKPAYERAREITKTLSPSKVRFVKLYRGELPFFHSYGIEQPLASVHRPEVRLPSGGSMVFAQTEALVTVDINSGRAIRERHIEETALKTNLEAIEELARQLRLRDLAGLIVIDFIGMERRRYNDQVEQRLKDALKHDRARTHVGRMSEFGLIEMSRQRLRASVHDTQHEPCATCHGHGWIYRPEAHALMVIRALECEVGNYRGCRFRVQVPQTCATHLSEVMWRAIHQLETQFEVRIEIQATTDPLPDHYALEVVRDDGTTVELNPSSASASDGDATRHADRSRRTDRRRATSRDQDAPSTRPTRRRRTRAGEADDAVASGSDDERRGRRDTGRGSRVNGTEATRNTRSRRTPPEAITDDDNAAGEDTRTRRTRTRAPVHDGIDDNPPEGRRTRRRRERTVFDDDHDGEYEAPRRRDAMREAADDDDGTDVRRPARSRRRADDETLDEPRSSRRRTRARPQARDDDASDEGLTADRATHRDSDDDTGFDEPRGRRRSVRAGKRNDRPVEDAWPEPGDPPADPDDEGQLRAFPEEPDTGARRGRRSGRASRDNGLDGTERLRGVSEDLPEETGTEGSPATAPGEAYDDEAEDSVFGERPETSASARTDRPGRRTRRGSRGGSRRRGTRSSRADTPALEPGRDSDAGASGRATGRQRRPRQSEDATGSLEPNPFETPFAASEADPASPGLASDSGGADPFGGRPAASDADTGASDPNRGPEPTVTASDPFSSGRRRRAAPDPDASVGKRKADAKHEDPFSARATSGQNGSAPFGDDSGPATVAGSGADDEPRSPAARLWNALRNRP